MPRLSSVPLYYSPLTGGLSIEGMEPDSERPADYPLLSILDNDALIRSVHLLAGEVVAR